MASAYTAAIESTADTIVQRARLYKRLVIGLSLGAMVLVLVAIVWRRWWPFCSVALLPSLVIGYFAMDLRLVHRWRDAVMAAWVDDDLDLDLLIQTLKKVPTLPAPTVEGMLDCLPVWPGDQAPMPVRLAVVRVQQRIAAWAEEALWRRATGWALGVSAATLVMATGSFVWLFAFLLLPIAGGVVFLGRRSRVEKILTNLRTEWCAAVGNLEGCRAVLKSMNWQGVPPADVSAWQLAAARMDTQA